MLNQEEVDRELAGYRELAAQPARRQEAIDGLLTLEKKGECQGLRTGERRVWRQAWAAVRTVLLGPHSRPSCCGIYILLCRARGRGYCGHPQGMQRSARGVLREQGPGWQLQLLSPSMQAWLRACVMPCFAPMHPAELFVAVASSRCATIFDLPCASPSRCPTSLSRLLRLCALRALLR